MLIFAIDDEQATLDELHDAIAQAEPYAEIMDFRRAADALDAIEEGHAPDVVFSDIQMPGIDGLSFAVEVKKEVPGVKVIFVTGYEQYAVEAFRRRVNGYLMKPVDAAMVREELDALGLPMQAADPEKLLVRCFGWFDVFWHNEPLIFARTQTKELFAYLVDREDRRRPLGGYGRRQGPEGLSPRADPGSSGDPVLHRDGGRADPLPRPMGGADG